MVLVVVIRVRLVGTWFTRVALVQGSVVRGGICLGPALNRVCLCRPYLVSTLPEGK